MKPGTIKSDIQGPGQVQPSTPTTEGKPAQQARPELRMPEGKSQLPEGRSSQTTARGESQLVRTQADAKRAAQKRTGKRQKFLKVPTVKTLSKQARMAFRALADLLGKAKELLERFRRKSMDDESDENQRRRQHEEGIPEAEEPKIDPSKVPRPGFAT